MSDLATQDVIDGEIVDHANQLQTMPDLPYLDLFTQHRQQTILKAVSRGASYKQMAHVSNVPYKALRSWLKHAEDWPEGPSAIFARRVLHDKAEWELDIFNKMIENGSSRKDFFPLIRALEQSNPEDYTRPTGPGTTVNVQVNNVDKLNQVRRASGDSPMLTG